MVELVDAEDSKSSGLYALASSSLASGTIFYEQMLLLSEQISIINNLVAFQRPVRLSADVKGQNPAFIIFNMGF